MNARERNLLIGLGAIVALGLFSYGSWRWFIVPLRAYNAQILDLTNDNEALETQLLKFQQERKKLDLAKLKSLPANKELAIQEYNRFLTGVLDSSKLTYKEISHNDPQEVKMVAPIEGIKATGHRVMTFSVKAEGQLSQLLSALETIHKTPYEHRIRTLSVHRSDLSMKKDSSSHLVINMTIETLLVAKTQNKEGTFAVNQGKLKDTMQLPENRQYAKVAERNIFTGVEPIYKTKDPPKIKNPEIKIPVKPPEPKPTPELIIPKFVRLTTTIPDQQTVYFHNRLSEKNAEVKLVAQQKGSDTFRFMDDKLRNYEFCNIKVLQVDLREVYFQAKDQMYMWSYGQTLYDALQKPLDEEYIEYLAVRGVEMDYAWGAEEKAGKTSGSPIKKGTKGGRE